MRTQLVTVITMGIVLRSYAGVLGAPLINRLLSVPFTCSYLFPSLLLVYEYGKKTENHGK